MISPAKPVNVSTTTVGVQTAPPVQFINWPAIIAGAAVATATMLVLTQFGAAAGLGLTSAYENEGLSAPTLGVLGILWFAFMHLYSAGLGGYIAGRLRPHAGDMAVDETGFRDGMNGLVVWGLGTILSAMMLYFAVSGIVRTAASAGGQALTSVATGAATAGLPNINADYATDLFLRSATGTQSQANPRSDADVRAEVGRILMASAASGEVSQPDRDYLAAVVSQRTGLAAPEAKARVDESINRANQLREDAKRKAKEVADATRSAVSKAGFWMAILALLSSAAAWYAARFGGRHRDENRYR